mgnify:CR=1 FL=1
MGILGFVGIVRILGIGANLDILIPGILGFVGFVGFVGMVGILGFVASSWQ